MAEQIPKLLFVGAGNIAQSIIKGIIKAAPYASQQILATAPTTKNLEVIKETLGCNTTLLKDASDRITQFKPDYAFICVKPQVLLNSILHSKSDKLYHVLKNVPKECMLLSLLAGVRLKTIYSNLDRDERNISRVMLNVAAEIGSTSVLYYTHGETDSNRSQELERLFRLIGQAVVKLNDEHLVDVATGVCGSGIAFFYEVIQTFSDIAVKNGLNRADATLVAAQLSKSAGEMLLAKRLHPYQLRDDVTSPAGTTIYGLSTWHERSVNVEIGRSIQASIDRAKNLADNMNY